MNRHILVTGGSGFLGSYILRYLIKEGFTRITATRSSPSTTIPDDLVDAVQWVDFKMPDRASAFELVIGVDCVIHSAAFVSYSRKDKDQLMKINRDATAELIDACLAENVKSFVYISSIATLGKPEDSPVIDEQSPWETNDASTPYGLTKYLGEMEVWRGAAEGLFAAAVLPAIILGSGPGHSSSLELIAQVKGPLKMYPGGTSGFVDVRDVARFAVELVKQDRYGDRWILSGHTMSYGEVFNRLGKAFGLSAKYRKAPKWVMQYLYGTYRALRGSALSPEIINQMNGRYDYQSGKSQTLPGFSYTPLETTIRDIGKAYSKHGIPENLPV